MCFFFLIFPAFHIEFIVLFSHGFFSIGCEVHFSVVFGLSFGINDMSIVHMASHFELESEVKSLTELMSIAVNGHLHPNSSSIHISYFEQ